ncbi:MAG: cytochrome c-type biogenesis protein CcmH [Gammaproteobacteria bacterium]|nr:MAG: cytochrome c-type biogenesis protein CcmH [Gammaproteobacteria bacterium]
MLSLLLTLLLMFPLMSHAKIEAYSFDDPAQEESYNKLIAELRCLVCQNQNLADSNAELAQDMRRKTYEMVRAGKSEKEISDFMVTRYGDFVMYRPPMKSTTLLLWFGPLVIFLIALTIVITYMRKQKKQQTPVEIPDQLQQKAHAILDDERS